jgi:hypothetical protein
VAFNESFTFIEFINKITKLFSTPSTRPFLFFKTPDRTLTVSPVPKEKPSGIVL